jgi:hypothetical protein
MTAVNSVLSFAGMPSLPYGGVGDSGLGASTATMAARVRPAEGHHDTPRAVAAAGLDLARDPVATARRVMVVVRLVHGRSRLPQPPSEAARFRR